MKNIIFIALLANFATVFCTEQPQSSRAAPVESSDVNERKIPFFLSKAANISAPEGSTVRLGCRTENLGEHVQLWKFTSAETKKVTILFADAHSIQRNRFADITLNSSSGSDQLVISSMSSDKQGTFCCEISTKSLTRLCHNVSLATGNEVQNQTLTSVEFAARTNVSTESPVVTSSTSVKPSLAPSTTASYLNDSEPMPEFITKSENYLVERSSIVNLECDVKNLGTYKRFWTHISAKTKQKTILYSQKFKITVENFENNFLNSSTYALKVFSLEPEQQGSFCCYINTLPATELCYGFQLATSPIAFPTVSRVTNETFGVCRCN